MADEIAEKVTGKNAADNAKVVGKIAAKGVKVVGKIAKKLQKSLEKCIFAPDK